MESFRKGCLRKSDQCSVEESEAESVGRQQASCKKGIRHLSLKGLVRVHVTSSSIEDGIMDAAHSLYTEYLQLVDE